MSLGNFQFWKDVASQLRTSVPFVSEALNVLPLIDTKRVPYAATDGRSIMVNTEGWAEMEEHLETTGESYPTPQGAVATVLLHECYHVILKHGKRGQGVPRRKQWAKAVDIATNNMLVDTMTLAPFNYHGDKMTQYKKALAASGTFDERFRGKNTDEIYELICAEEPEEEEPPTGDPGESGTATNEGTPTPAGGGDGESEDEDDDGQGNGESEEDGEEQEQGTGSGGQGGTQKPPTPPPAPPPKPLDGDLADDLDSGVPDDVEELIDNAMQDYLDRNAQYAPAGSSLAREMAEAKKKPPILMSQVLKKIRDVISGMVFDYRKPSRNDAFAVMLGSEGRMPSYHADPSDKLRELVVALDFSGSMGENERQTAFSLVRDAFKNVKREIRLLVFTDHVVQDEVVTSSTVLTSGHSGGTCIASIIGYMDNPTICSDPSKNGRKIKPSAIVIVTDAVDPGSMPLLERWRYKNRMRNIVIGTKLPMPGLTFYVDCVDGFPRN